MKNYKELPVPVENLTEKCGSIYNPKFNDIADVARGWAKKHNITCSNEDEEQVVLLAIDNQNSFVMPDGELSVMGAVEDNMRLCEFIYKNLNNITCIFPTMDTHSSTQIFHPIFWVNKKGQHPKPLTVISLDDVKKDKWRFNENILTDIFDNEFAYMDKAEVDGYIFGYVKALDKKGKFPLTVWPYHALLGSVGHALTSAFSEACFFHSVARQVPCKPYVKGTNFLTEHYSVFRDEYGEESDPDSTGNIVSADKIIIAGQAKSHCVSWTIADLLDFMVDKYDDPKISNKIYLLEDCTSPVVVPGVIDYTEKADKDFRRFAEAGVNIVKSTTPINEWKGM